MPATRIDFEAHFEIVDDPRIERSTRHVLKDILFLAVTATIAGADGPSDIEQFGKDRADWLRRFVDLKNGVPSHDTIGRVFSLIKPEQFQKAFLSWITALTSSDKIPEGPKLIPIDGKTVRGSYTNADKSNPLHLVSAWATQRGLTLGQVATDEKSNEITAIPRLLELLELRGAIVTIDAMGCQKHIAEKIIDEGGDYVLAAKDNQPKLREAIEAYFLQTYEAGAPCREVKTKEKSRGRIEERLYRIAALPPSLRHLQDEWKGLNSIGQVITTTQRHGKTTDEVRYFIGSITAKAGLLRDSVRGHWGIENGLHWVLDVVFGEDASRIHQGHASENFAFLRRFVTSLLRRDTSRSSLIAKRKRAGWNTAFLENLLFGRTI